MIINLLKVSLAALYSSHLGRPVSVGSADQRTPADPQPLTQQLGHGSRSQQPGQVLRLLQVEDASSRAAGGPALQDNGARGPGPWVEVGHQPLRLPEDKTGDSGGHSVERKEKIIVED